MGPPTGPWRSHQWSHSFEKSEAPAYGSQHLPITWQLGVGPGELLHAGNFNGLSLVLVASAVVGNSHHVQETGLHDCLLHLSAPSSVMVPGLAGGVEVWDSCSSYE